MTPSVTQPSILSIGSSTPSRSAKGVGAGTDTPALFDEALRAMQAGPVDTPALLATRQDIAPAGKTLPDAGSPLDWLATLETPPISSEPTQAAAPTTGSTGPVMGTSLLTDMPSIGAARPDLATTGVPLIMEQGSTTQPTATLKTAFLVAAPAQATVPTGTAALLRLTPPTETNLGGPATPTMGGSAPTVSPGAIIPAAAQMLSASGQTAWPPAILDQGEPSRTDGEAVDPRHRLTPAMLGLAGLVARGSVKEMAGEKKADAPRDPDQRDAAADHDGAAPDAVPPLDLMAALMVTSSLTVPAPRPANGTAAAQAAPVAITAGSSGQGQPAALALSGQAVPADLPFVSGVPAPDTSGLATLTAFAGDPGLTAVQGPVIIEPGSDQIVSAAVARDTAPAAPAAMSLAPAAAAPQLPTGKPMPAGELFAAAMHATRDDAGMRPVADRDDAAGLPSINVAGLTTHAVGGAAAATGAEGAPLDMGQERWPNAMLDRIERMRDDANAADTRIRLVPDALGSVDVAVRREGDTLHVRFHASEAATRTLLTDAQPRLAEIAEERSLKLGQSSVGGGSTGANDGNRAPPRPAPVLAARPASARAESPQTIDARVG